MLEWACERAGREVAAVAARVPKIAAWIRGEERPTRPQLEELARVTHTPLGYLFLREPPEEPLDIPDLRAPSAGAGERPSPDLLETLYAMQRRRDWLHEVLASDGEPPLAFVGGARLTDDPVAAGREMRRVLEFDAGWAVGASTWRDVARELRRSIERLGVTAVVNGVVGNDARRRLNAREFRGFALADPLAPMIFVNGADAKSTQSFTLAHELAHVRLGRDGLSGFEDLSPGGCDVENWCAAAAAETLVPAEALRARWTALRHDAHRFERIARALEASPVVVARRALDLGLVDRGVFRRFYAGHARRGGGAGASGPEGGFYGVQNARVGESFAKQVIGAALGGRVGFKEAYRLVGLRGATFQEYARRLGFKLP